MIKFQLRQVQTQTVIAAGTLWWCSLCGASPDETSPDRSVAVGDPAAEHQRLRERTTMKFTCAAFLSPLHDATAGRGVWMAPLLLQEIRCGEAPTFPKFGAVTASESNQYAIDENRLTVYTTARRIRIGGRRYRQDTYVWFYPPAEAEEPLRYRGFRQTLGRKGFPVIREVISSETTERIFFVSKSLERAAARQFGPPFPGRRFSVEPRCWEQHNVIVARVLADGAQPMGPFIYLDNVSLAIPNLKCRCEPSQIGEFTLSRHYQLVSLPSFEKLLAERPPAEVEDLPLPANAVQLNGVLRLPNSM